MDAFVTSIFDRLRRCGLDARLIADATEVTPHVSDDWLRGIGRPDARARARLDSLVGIAERLSTLYGPDEIACWLSSPHPLLGGETALSLVRLGRRAEVERTICALDTGAFT